jgi:hypothetical protein
MSLKQISVDEFLEGNRRRFGASDPRDRAVINRPPSYFEETFACRFEDERDDLDELKIAFFSVNADLVFGLSRYKRQPDQNGTTVLLQRQYSDAEVETVLDAIRDAFKLTPNDILMLITDGISLIRKRPQMYGGERPWGPSFAANLAENVIYLGVLPVYVHHFDGWWTVSSEKDWLLGTDGSVSYAAFSNFLPDPAKRANSLRSEVVIAALADAVVTCGRDGTKWITGDPRQRSLPSGLSDRMAAIDKGRVVSFSIDGEKK